MVFYAIRIWGGEWEDAWEDILDDKIFPDKDVAIKYAIQQGFELSEDDAELLYKDNYYEVEYYNPLQDSACGRLIEFELITD